MTFDQSTTSIPAIDQLQSQSLSTWLLGRRNLRDFRIVAESTWFFLVEYLNKFQSNPLKVQSKSKPFFCSIERVDIQIDPKKL